MSIASSTQQGFPKGCPVCGQTVCIEQSLPFGDVSCADCGSSLWFISTERQMRLLDPASEIPSKLLLTRFGISVDDLRSRRMQDLPIDSLERVDLVLELEAATE